MPRASGTVLRRQETESRRKTRCETPCDTVRRIRKPPVGSSSLPVGSAISRKLARPACRVSALVQQSGTAPTWRSHVKCRASGTSSSRRVERLSLAYRRRGEAESSVVHVRPAKECDGGTDLSDAASPRGERSDSRVDARGVVADPFESRNASSQSLRCPASSDSPRVDLLSSTVASPTWAGARSAPASSGSRSERAPTRDRHCS